MSLPAVIVPAFNAHIPTACTSFCAKRSTGEAFCHAATIYQNGELQRNNEPRVDMGSESGMLYCRKLPVVGADAYHALTTKIVRSLTPRSSRSSQPANTPFPTPPDTQPEPAAGLSRRSLAQLARQQRERISHREQVEQQARPAAGDPPTDPPPPPEQPSNPPTSSVWNRHLAVEGVVEVQLEAVVAVLRDVAQVRARVELLPPFNVLLLRIPLSVRVLNTHKPLLPAVLTPAGASLACAAIRKVDIPNLEDPPEALRQLASDQSKEYRNNSRSRSSEARLEQGFNGDGDEMDGSQEISALDTDERVAIDLFLSISNDSGQASTSVRDALLRRYPTNLVLSYYTAKKLVSELGGIVYVTYDMCIASCMAYMGPWGDLEA
ncbi:hypothetical protein R3P38DRAFT_3206446 [Favolaschia claudopus]|uniref:Uncharacterized protein n=1 Tax=Favolaschia claudopus TaxID=2862362 RepID=A0AAW0ALA7_9AGAR